MVTGSPSRHLVIAAITTHGKLVPAANLTESISVESLVLCNGECSLTQAMLSMVLDAALRMLLRELRVIVVAVPTNAPRTMVGTLRLGVFTTGRRLKGHTWTWGPYTCAPPISGSCRSRMKMGFIQHTYFTGEACGRECSRCKTKTTCGGEFCHKCIVAGLDSPHAPLPNF
jgi:hypothetical protein